MDRNGKIIPEDQLRNLWVIVRDVGMFDENYQGRAYLIPDGRWGPEDLAAAWHEHEKALAEEVAAAIVLSDPGTYFGKIRVEKVLG